MVQNSSSKASRKPFSLLTSLLAFLFLCIILVYTWAQPSSGSCVIPQNAAWVGNMWVNQLRDEEAIQGFARQHAENNISVIYVNTSYSHEGDHLLSAATYLPEFIKIYRRYNTTTQIQAWIGILVENPIPIGVNGWANLSDPQTRQILLSFIEQNLAIEGIDGVHLDVETVMDGDENFLWLLDETRARLKPTQHLSISGNHWMPPVLDRIPVIGKFRWSSAYYRQVAEKTNQIAVMTYDTYLPHPWLYSLSVREEMKGILKSTTGTPAGILIGLSVSHEKTRSHQPAAENLTSGLAGYCSAVNQLPPETSRLLQGISIYASWEANDEDWALLK